jgi:hypothetical protein
VTHWMVVAGALGAGAALLVWGGARLRGRRSLAEAVPECRIAELEAGRFRLVGRVTAIESSPSFVDGTDCVYLERAEYRTVGSALVPLLREVEHGAITHPFYLEDESGRILVDPAQALIDCATATADEGLTAERRLRVGEEVSLVASFRSAQTEVDGGEGPYRSGAQHWAPVSDMSGPPRLSHRTEEGMIRMPPDDVSAFLGGAGAIMLLLGALLGLLTWFAV